LSVCSAAGGLPAPLQARRAAVVSSAAENMRMNDEVLNGVASDAGRRLSSESIAS